MTLLRSAVAILCLAIPVACGDDGDDGESSGGTSAGGTTAKGGSSGKGGTNSAAGADNAAGGGDNAAGGGDNAAGGGDNAAGGGDNAAGGGDNAAGGGDNAAGGGDNAAAGTANGAGGAPGGSRCEEGCALTLAADCQNGPATQEQCVTFCEAQAAGACSTEYGAFQDCAEGQEISCGPAGIPVVEACADQQDAFIACLGG